MNTRGKAVIRQIILDLILGVNRKFLHDIAVWHDLDPLEVLEFYEEQMTRVDKLFNFPTAYLEGLSDET